MTPTRMEQKHLLAVYTASSRLAPAVERGTRPDVIDVLKAMAEEATQAANELARRPQETP